MEDAASVLEQFVQDVANLPAEIAHLLEEVQAKEVIIQECLKNISRCDNSLQKFYKASGPLTAHPKEDVYCKQVEQHYARAQKLQEEKVALSEKAGVLLDRHVKRLDIKIRDLQADGSIALDPQLPSLLHHSTANRASISSTPTGTSTPLNNLHHNAQPSTTIANNPALRLPHPMIVQQARPNATPANILSNPLIPAHLVSSNPTSPAASGQFNRRDSNASLSDTSKKRKLNPTQANQAAPSNLKQTTLTNLAIPNNKPSSGPGSRGSSAGPRSKKTSTGGPKKLAPHQAAAARKSGKPGSTNLKALHHKRALKQALGAANGRGIKGSASGSQSAEESESGAESGSESEDAAGAGRAPPPPDTSNEAVREDEEMEDVGETEGDDRKYCICQTVSHGDMVACDNEECPNEWFHWECVGLTKEPVGKWFCPDCRKKLGGPGRS